MATGYKPTLETTNFAKLSWIIMDVCRDALFDIVSHEIAPADIPSKIKATPHKVKLFPEQKKSICNKPGGVAPNSGDFDVSSLYTIIRNLCRGIQPPANGWFDNNKQNYPAPADIGKADDIERLRSKRNILVGHTKSAELSDTDFQKEISEIKQILTRLDRQLGSHYVDAVTDIETCCMDPEKEQQYIQAVEEQERRDEETRELLKIEQTKVKNLTARQDADRSLHEQTRENVSELEKGLVAVKEDQTKTNKSLIELEEKQKQETTLHEQTRENVGELEKDHNQTREKVSGLEKGLVAVIEDQTKTSKSLIELEEKQKQETTLHEQTRENVGELEKDHNQTREKVSELEKDHNQTRENVSELEKDHNQTREKVSGLEKGLEAVKEDRTKTSKSLMEQKQNQKFFEEQLETQKLKAEEDRAILHTLQQQQADPAAFNEEPEPDQPRLQEHLRQRYQDDGTCKVSGLPSSYHDVLLSQIFAPIVIREDLEKANQEEGNSESYVQHREVAQKSGETENTVQSYFDIFKKKNVLQKNIFMLGQAGSGKTTFCKHVVDIWCRSSDKDHYEGTEVIRGFEFVFFVACRNAEKSETIMDMILNQLFASETEHLYSTVRHVLKAKPEQCLIIIDGLDEWAGSPSKGTGPRTPCGLPNRKELENCVVMTTSRPWRIEALRQGLGKNPRILEIQGLTNTDMETLSENLLKALKVSDVAAALEAFLNDVKTAKMTEMLRTPLMLIIVLTTWQQAKRKLDKSVCVNFSSMLESLIQRAEGESGRTDDTDRLSNISHFDKLKKRLAKQGRPLPSCFSSMDYCEEYSALIYKLAKFAFDTLFHETKEKSLVFSIEELEQRFEKSELDVCVRIGIFSLASAPVKSEKRFANLSFLHKSLQEYLAALWMASDSFKDCLTVFKSHCKSLTNVLDYSKVVLFACGLAPVKGRELWSCIGEVTRADPVLQEHRQSVTPALSSVRSEHPATKSVIRLYQLALDCSTEASHSQPDQPGRHLYHYMLPDIYVGREMSADQRVLVYDQVQARPSEVKSLIIDDTELAPELEHNLHKLVSLERLHIALSYIPSRQQCSRLCSTISKLSSLRSLYMENCWPRTDSGRLLTLELHSLPLLRHLTLMGGRLSITPSGRSLISPRLQLSLPVTMTSLNLSGVTLSHSSMESLTSLLSSTASLQQLYIVHLQCLDCGRGGHDIHVDLVQHSQLEQLELSDVYGVVQTVRVGKDTRSLRYVWLGYIQMSAGAWRSFLLSLPRPAHRLTVELWGVNIDADIVADIEPDFTVTENNTLSDGRRYIEFHSGVPP